MPCAVPCHAMPCLCRTQELWGRFLVVSCRAKDLCLGATNTVYLFHGTKWSNLRGILADGFDEHVSKRALYGDGCYFAAQMCKALQYTDINGAGDQCVLYCWVILGRPYKTQDALRGLRALSELQNWYEEGWLLQQPDAKLHSVVVDPGRKRRIPWGSQVHHEYVVFCSAQVYPEYILHVRA
jgi:hypothetical protein